jgi:hypothetical protein
MNRALAGVRLLLLLCKQAGEEEMLTMCCCSSFRFTFLDVRPNGLLHRSSGGLRFLLGLKKGFLPSVLADCNASIAISMPLNDPKIRPLQEN